MSEVQIIRTVEERLTAIEERNRRVEADKAWETSWFRILSLTLITYIVAVFVLFFVGAKNFLLGALVPAVGYFLSMRSLPIVKRWWVRKYAGHK